MALTGLVRGLRTLGGHDYREEAPGPIALHDLFTNSFDVVGNLRNQHDICRSSHAGMKRDEPGTTTHHFYYHHTIVAFSSSVQFVDCFDRRIHRGIEAECRNRTSDIVVNCLRHCDDLHSFLAKLLSYRHRSITTDGDYRIDPVSICIFQ